MSDHSPWTHDPNDRQSNARPGPAELAETGLGVSPSVVIVGAGPAGLAAAAALRRRAVAAVVLEQGPGVGTSWRLRHDELRLNTIRWLSDLPGLRMPRSLGRWVRRDDYIAYLEAYVERQHLDIRPGVRVRRVDPSEGGWQITSSAGEHQTEHVVIATGHDRAPWIPHWPGRDTYPKPVLHVTQVRRATDLTGLRVLLVGAGNTGIETARHLVDAGVAALWVSVRTPPTILPRELGGIPIHPLTPWARVLPERARDAGARILARLAFGDLAHYGLPAPPEGPYARMRSSGVTVAVDHGFVRHLKAGRLDIVADVDQFTDTDVVLRDGRRLRPDVVLAATGFHRGLAPMVGHLDLLDARGLPPRSSPEAARAGLWFIGFQAAIEGNLRQHSIEARHIARSIAKTRPGSGRR